MSEPGTLPKHLSASSISTFQQCPMKFKLSRVDGHSEPPTIHTLMGNFVHEVLERMYADYKPEDRNVSTARSLCTSIWESGEWESKVKPYLGKTTLNEFRWSCWWCVENLFDMEDPTAIQPDGVEYELNDDIDGVVIKGFIDRWQREKLDTAKITDYKTGKTPNPRYASDKFFQLTLYAAMLEKSLGVDNFELELLYLKDGARLTHTPTRAEIEAVKETVVTVRREIENCHANNNWETKPSALCNWCIFKQGLCSYWN
jgi:putative RecB family exonuclease